MCKNQWDRDINVFLLLFVNEVYVDDLGSEDLGCLSAGQYERCVTIPGPAQNSASARGRSSWCWEGSIKTGSAVVRETERAWCLLATPPSSCDFCNPSISE